MGATAASTVACITPLVGVALGAVVLHEEVTWNQLVGAGIVIVGIILAQSRSVTAQKPEPGMKELA